MTRPPKSSLGAHIIILVSGCAPLSMADAFLSTLCKGNPHNEIL
jgi:hypothetical protein